MPPKAFAVVCVALSFTWPRSVSRPGVPDADLELALRRLQAIRAMAPAPATLTVIDYLKPSSEKRLWGST
jgi:hypothetical protein